MAEHNPTHLLQCKNVHAWYGDKHILKDISFEAHLGELVCVIGPNGSGKSTFLSLLSGIEKSSLSYKGSILVNNRNLDTMKRNDIALQISLMTQSEHSVWDFLVQEAILSGRFSHTSWSKWYSKHDTELVEEAMSDLHIHHLANRSIHSLSGGELQRVRIARSIVQQSPFLLLDEPVANLDIGCQNDILKKLRDIAHNKNNCVIIAIHDLNAAAAFADRIVLLKSLQTLDKDEAQILSGSVEQIIASDLLHGAYGTTFKTFSHPIFGYPQVCVVDNNKE